MQRVVIIGPSGAGKSTLAPQLAERTGLPVHHMDRLHWKPGWQASTRQELIERLRPILAQDRWIIDGNYGGTMELRFGYADTVIFLDPPPRVYRWRVIKRIITGFFGRTRPDMTEGCPERISLEFLRYVWEFDKHTRPRILQKLAGLNGSVKLIELRTDAEVRAFLATLPARCPRNCPRKCDPAE